jgi:hypothetical protein|tara:strand:+ start:1573 stop:1782 length:210 start_codon:yes stop_codon:yes gene_type:complete
MQIVIGSDIKTMTGYEKRGSQIRWFEENGITYRVNAKGDVWTTDDWLNGRDKAAVDAANDDGFNAGFMK